MNNNDDKTAASDANAENDSVENDPLENSDARAVPSVVPGWTCPKCGTDVEFPRDSCWNCLYNPSAC